MTTQPRHLHAVPDAVPRSYTPEFRAIAVARVDAGEPLATVARELGVARNTIKNWIRATDQAPADGQSLVNSGIVAAAASGSLRAVLVSLRSESAGRIAGGVSAREFPGHARLLLEAVREIEALDEAEKVEQDAVEHAPDEPLNPEEL